MYIGINNKISGYQVPSHYVISLLSSTLGTFDILIFSHKGKKSNQKLRTKPFLHKYSLSRVADFIELSSVRGLETGV